MLACRFTGGDGADRVVLRIDGALADRNHVCGVFGGEGVGKLDKAFGKSTSTFRLLLSPCLSHRTRCYLSILTCGNSTQ